MQIVVDADACPVKDEVYVVASRFSLPVVLVACSAIAIPRGVDARLVRVPTGLDAADDWIAANVRAHDVIVTADIPLAGRCLEVGAHVIGPTGQRFTEDSIGGALAVRQIKEDLRSAGVQTRGPRPLSDRDRSRFLGQLHQVVDQAVRARLRAAGAPGAVR
jgi:uncharacterized protein YaiI (UPF0178 family)